MVNGRNLFVQFGDPVSLRAALNDGADAARSVRRLMRTLRLALAQQRAAAIGPDLSHRRTIVTQVLRAGAVRRAMADEMRTKKISRREALKLGAGLRARRSPRTTRTSSSPSWRASSRWFWTRLYDGVELHHFDTVAAAIATATKSSTCRATAATSTTCCCRTLLYYKGYAVPHIAAGINLNMPVLGRFLRNGGAFFMRRSFKGNALYSMVFMNTSA